MSATLLASITPLGASFIDATQKTNFSTALAKFLKHVFEGQSVYNVEIIGATIFDEQFISVTKNIRARNLLTNQLQSGQFNFIQDGVNGDDDGSDDDGSDDWEGYYSEGDENEEGNYEALSVMDALIGESNQGDENDENVQESNDTPFNEKSVENVEQSLDTAEENVWVVDESEWLPEDADLTKSKDTYTLKVATVISAEHIADEASLSHSDFEEMLLHICAKFADHLAEYVRDSDTYFSTVETVLVSPLRSDKSAAKLGSTTKFGVKGLSPASIVGIVAAGIVFVFVFFGSIKLIKRERQLKRNKWRSQEIASANAAGSSVKSLRVLYNRSAGDDYSFDPFGTETPPIFYTDAVDTSFCVADHEQNDHLRLRRSNGAAGGEESEVNSSLLSENSTASRQEHIYAPPGKVGVAIDVVNGQPTVHKIRNGSPLEGVLQHGDIILSIDDVETTNMSAADVTHLMVKRMNYRRKISFIRSDNRIQ